MTPHAAFDVAVGWKRGRVHLFRQARPLHLAELVRNMLFVLSRVVDHDWHKECLMGGDQMRAIDGELPFEPEISLGAVMGARNSLWSNQTSMPASRSAWQIFCAASASCDA